MKKSELDDIESQLDKLIVIFERTKLENIALHKKNRSLTSENVELLGKKKKTATSLKGLINQLQDGLCQK